MILWAVPLIGAGQNVDLLILDRNYSQALLQIEKSLEVRSDAELYLKQANIYQQLSKPLYAVKSLENSISLDSTNSKYLAEYAELQAEMGNPYKAVIYYQKAVDNSKDDLNLKCRLGKAYMNIEDYKNAFGVFSMIQMLDSTNLVYNKQLGLAAFRIGEIDLAIRMFESVLEHNPNDFNTYMNLLSLYLKKKDAVHIVRTSGRALYFFPENSAILFREANSLYVLKEYEEAGPLFEFYLAQNDSVFEVLENYGITLYFNHDELKARKIMEKCFALNPTDQFVNYYLGLICKKLADFPKCVEYLNMAIAASQPAYLTNMYHLLGQAFGLQREFDKSIEALQKAYNCNPLECEILVEIATTYEEFNPNKKLALDYYQKYLKEAGDLAVNAEYAQERISKIEEKLYFKKKQESGKSKQSR